ncbi:hypothetical protein [Helicobacter typhlonius]|uniref:hypothetical protein n=1 Tax=Helicobacter typhlonius TaxID=76936 RepID=UPI003A5C7DA3
MTFEEINVDSIRKLMDIFYAKVRADKSGLGDIFNTKIGTSDEVCVCACVNQGFYSFSNIMTKKQVGE